MAAAAIIMAAGAAVSVYGSIQQGEQEKEAYARQSYLKGLQADQMLQGAEREAELTKKRGDEVTASQVTAYGSAGVDLSGSPLQMIAKSQADARSQADAIMQSGRYRAFTSQYEGADAKILGDQAQQAGYYKGLGTALGAGGSYMKDKGNL